MAKWIYFTVGSIYFMIKSVYFAAKSIDFAAKKGYLQARQSGLLQYKSFILRELAKKPLKRQQNDFTTKIGRTRRKR